MADAVEAARQEMEQEAADEFLGTECHDALALTIVTSVILVAEGNTCLVEGEQPTVRDGDPVRIAREIGKYRFRSSERRLGIDHPALAAGW